MANGFIVRAGWVYGAGRGVIREGAVGVESSVITAVGEFSDLRRRFAGAGIIELPDCVLLPGLVNAHGHLELADLRGEVGYEGDFTDWVRRLVQLRGRKRGDLAKTVAAGVRESLSYGVTTVGDISYEHQAWSFLAKERIRKVCFAEVFATTADLAGPGEYLRRCIAKTEGDELLRLGLSPHAPYSTRGEVYELTAALAAEHGLIVTSHLAEDKGEFDFLRDGSGEWVGFLRERGRWDGSFAFPGERPVEYFLGLDLRGQRFLLAHVNYANEQEIAGLAQAGHSVVYCPRSHDFFGHQRHPLMEMLGAGVNVCLGTDSLASNDSLSMLAEMKLVYEQFPGLSPERIIDMATRGGALGLGLQNEIGVLKAGYKADLVALRVAGDEVLREVVGGECECALTMVDGEVVYIRQEA